MGRRFCHTPSDNAKPCGMLYQTSPRLIARNMPEVPINIMDQYYPDNLCDSSSSKYRERYSEISRPPTEEEIIRSYQYAKDLGLNFETLSFLIPLLVFPL